ncbi:MAG: ATP-dependent zinc metalloprotease FtsH [Opitutales bacterium]
MPDQDSNNEKRPPRNTPPEKYQPKVLVIWMVIFAAIASLWIFNPGNQSAVDTWKIAEVVEAAAAGTVIEGTITPDKRGAMNSYEITGKYIIPGRNEPGQFKAYGSLTDESLGALQETKIFDEVPSNTLLSEILVSLLPFILIIGLLYFLFVRQLRMAGRGAMSFGKSKAKMLNRDRQKIFFDDVAGCDEAKEEVSEVVQFLKDPKKFQKMGGQIPKGLLMVGPPGTGKTLLAKAVAGEADVPFFSISGSDFVEMFVGVGASRVRDMFEQGRKNAPCLIFIDEIDAVGRQRGAGVGGGNDEREQTLNSLLVEMDGFEVHEGVIIMAATNRPDVLDSALLRPGRFDRQVMIDLPDLGGRTQILKVHAKKIILSDAVDLEMVARITPGLSGADLANLLNEAALTAARYDKKKVEMTDIEEAREKIQYGREHRRIMDDEDKKLVAYHEAGHALIQAIVDDGTLPLHKVTIIPRGQSLGSTMFLPKKDTYNYSKKRMLNQICSIMGGRIAEELVLGDVTSGASGDIKQATKIARHMVCDWGMSSLGPLALGDNQDTVFLGRDISRNHNYSEETARVIDSEIHRLVDEQYQRATEIMKENRESLDKIAVALMEHETVEGKHVHEIIDHGEIRSAVIKNIPVKERKKKESAETDRAKKKKEIDPPGDPAGAMA